MTLTTQSANRKDLNTAKQGVKLQHRHFAFIAAVIKGGNNYRDETARYMVALDFADACQRSNPRFDRNRFLAACGIE